MRRTTLALLLAASALPAADLWTGIAPGPHRIGFRFERTTDPTRRVPLGLATWYPASSAAGAPMTQLDYRLLAFSRPLDADARRAYLDEEAANMVAVRHLGIVPLTPDQARAAVNAPGRAVRNAPPSPGRFPVVVILGGAWYLSTTAEILASHGFLVVAATRFSDISDSVPALDFPWHMENAARDAEWALVEIARNRSADPTRAAALGHGGGGLQALLLAMRNPAITSVVNIDAGNFSTRSNPKQLAFYHPRLLHVPYLNILTADTRRSLDLYSDFESMRLSRRYEAVLPDPALRHHDLSDVGRGVSAVLDVRGEPRDMVLRTYAAVQQMVVRFLTTGDPRPSDIPVMVRDGVAPAPTTSQVIDTLADSTPAALREAHARDPEAQIFSVEELQKVVAAARTRPALAAQLGRAALDFQPNSLPLQLSAATALEAAGDRPAAREILRRCASAPEPRMDFRSSTAQAACRERAGALQ